MLADMTTLPVADTLPLQEAALQELRPGLHGQLIRPGDAEYDQARQLWNGAVDKHPALIVRAQAAQDVVLAVTFAQRYDLPVSVRAGGHNSAGLALADNGLVIDLSAMKGIKIDPDRRIARAEPGLTIGEFTAALQPYGLLAPTGTCSGTGIAGMTLGAASAGWRADLVWPLTTFSPLSWSRQRVSYSKPAPMRTLTCSGVCAAAAATLAW
jgi:FAD/FMN-containing dehydrogenase